MGHVVVCLRPLRAGLWIVMLAAAMLAAGARAAEARLPTGRPEQVGASSARLERITGLTRRYVDAGKLAGVVTLVARHGKVIYFDAEGQSNLETGAPMAKDTLFRIYSMSKPITTVAAMILYEEGRFQLTDPISKFLPELAHLEVLGDDGKRVPAQPITMQQLLTHTAGFSYGFDPNNPVDKLYRTSNLLLSHDLDQFVVRLSRLPLEFQPGTRWHYSVAIDVTGAVVERLSGERFDRFLDERVFQPLGMKDTFFDVPESKRQRLGTNHRYNRETERLEVLPVPEYPLYKDTTFFSGGGGLVSTAADYARFCQMLLNGGAGNGHRLLSPKTVKFMTTNHLPAALTDGGTDGPGPGVGFGLGFAVVTNVPKSGVIGSPGEYNWGGAAGTVFWIDPVEDLFVVSMIQLMGSSWPLRSELKTLTYGALTELD